MKIQCVGKTSGQIESKHEITYSQLSKPTSLDMYDLNIFSLQNELLFLCETGARETLDRMNDLQSIREMIKESKSAINIVVLPQNYIHTTYFNRGLANTSKMLKDELDNLVRNILYGVIPTPLSQSYSLIYENSGTKLLGSTFNSSFCFKELGGGIQVLSESIGGCKPTTVCKDRIILTTLNLFSDNSKFDDFLKGIGLDNEKLEVPEWLVDLDYFDDSIQKASITENEAKILDLKEQIAVSNEKIQENLKYKSILITNGKELVEIVFEMLERMLDCSLEDFEDENIEDFLIRKSDVTFVGEIKGVTSNVKSEHIAQVDRHCQAYKDKLEEESLTENVKSILILSPFRTKPLDERGEVHENQIHLAERNESLIITTDKFLKLFEMFINGDINSESIKNIFKSKIGLLDVSDFTQNSSGVVDNSAYTM